MKTSTCVSRIKQHGLLLLILVGVAVGIVIGFAIRPLYPSESAKMWLGLPGQLYLRSLKMMIVPLIISSVITGSATLDPRSNGRISAIAFIYVYLTNLSGALLGILAFVLFKPGQGGGFTKGYEKTKPTAALQTQDIFADLLRNIFPDNVFEATFTQTQTKYTLNESPVNTSVKDGNVTITLEKELVKGGGANFLGLIFACTLIGMAISSLKEKGKPLLVFFDAATKVAIRIVQWLMWLTPIGVFSLILVPVASIKDIGLLFGQLGLFSAAVTVFLIVQQALVLPLILFVTTRKNPYYHLSLLSRPWIISFAAAGTAVIIPEMLHVCEKKLGVDPRVSRFTIPFCVTLSANGSAVFIVCACLFISNLTDAPPNAATIMIVGILTSVSTLAIPSVPSASIVTIIMILTSLDISTEPIALLLTVEFFLDRLRTTSSLVSHTMCAVVTYRFCRGILKEIDSTEECLEDIEIKVAGGSRNPEAIPLKSDNLEKGEQL